MTMKQMQTISEFQLLKYRETKRELQELTTRGLQARTLGPVRGKGKHADPTAAQALHQLALEEKITTMRAWVWAIESARAVLEASDPEKATLMVRYYGLDKPLRACSKTRKNIELTSELGISEPTLYKWREEILRTVASAAIQVGVLVPYDGAPEHSYG